MTHSRDELIARRMEATGETAADVEAAIAEFGEVAIRPELLTASGEIEEGELL